MSEALKLQPDELRVEVVEGRDAFVQLEKEWNAALARGPRDEAMLRHEWLRAFIENFAPGATLLTFVVREGRQICAAAPFVETTDRDADTCFLPVVTWALPVNDHSQRGGILLGTRHEEALALLFRAVAETPGWERLRLRDLPEQAPEWALRALAEKAGLRCGRWVSLRSPYLPLTRAYDAVEKALDAKFRQNLRRRRRRLEEKGEVKYRLADAHSLDEALADFFDIEAGGWKGEGGTAIAQRPELVGFYTQIARDALKRKELALGTLTLAGRPIAAHLSIVHAGRHYLIKIGYDETLHEFSPGQQLVAEAIRDSCARGLREFDFLGPCMEWKLDWESKLRAHTWLTIFRATPKMRLVHGVRHTAWPIARALLRKDR
ncbi:MAG TPA: GNAT family N-acetyltransferase [Myxococcales bacterium]|nr:GNAT family N-acetyltransferase [Myxococcales bacterium]